MEETNRAMIQKWEEQAVKAGMIKTTSPFTDPIQPGREPPISGLACASTPPKGSVEMSKTIDEIQRGVQTMTIEFEEVEKLRELGEALLKLEDKIHGIAFALLAVAQDLEPHPEREKLAEYMQSCQSHPPKGVSNE